jgi:hypothetical protein
MDAMFVTAEVSQPEMMELKDCAGAPRQMVEQSTVVALPSEHSVP